MRTHKGLLFVMVLFAGSLLFLSSCGTQAPPPVQQPVAVTSPAPVPPTPPTKEELEKPPNIVLEKLSRDPFIPLAGPGGEIAAGAKGGKNAPGLAEGGYTVAGVMLDGGRSAILATGFTSYIVHPGDRIGGYRVSSITPKGVVLIGKGGKLSLSLPGHHSL